MAILRLASERRSRLSASSHQQSKALEERVSEVQAYLGDLWEQAETKGIAHLILVMQNNPLKSGGEILQRPDVQEALSIPLEGVLNDLPEYLTEQFRAAAEDSAERVAAEIAALGVEPVKVSVEPEEVINRAIGDLRNNADRFRRQVQTALQSPDKENRRVGIIAAGRTSRRNAELTAEWVLQRAVNDTRLAIFNASGVKKMWLSNLSPEFVGRRCEHCRELHGEVREVFEEFSRDTGVRHLPVYGGRLWGPPRHPHCRCILVPWIGEENPRIKAQAVEEAIAEDAPPPGAISSDTLRAIPSGLIGKFVAWFIRWLGR